MARTSRPLPVLTGGQPTGRLTAGRPTGGSAERRPASDVADAGLALAGQPGIAWAERAMPVLGMLRTSVRRATAVRWADDRLLPARHCRDRRAGPDARRPAAPKFSLPLPIRCRRRTTSLRRSPPRRASQCKHARASTGHLLRAHPPRPRQRPDLVMDDGGDLVNTLHEARGSLVAECAAAVRPLRRGGHGCAGWLLRARSASR